MSRGFGRTALRAGQIAAVLLTTILLVGTLLFLRAEGRWLHPTTRAPREAFLFGDTGTALMPLPVFRALPVLFPEPFQPGGAEAGAETLAVSSPADGSLVFQPDGLSAKPGNVDLEYDNPSAVPHSIAVATAPGVALAVRVLSQMSSGRTRESSRITRSQSKRLSARLVTVATRCSRAAWNWV